MRQRQHIQAEKINKAQGEEQGWVLYLDCHCMNLQPRFSLLCIYIHCKHAVYHVELLCYLCNTNTPQVAHTRPKMHCIHLVYLQLCNSKITANLQLGMYLTCIHGSQVAVNVSSNLTKNLGHKCTHSGFLLDTKTCYCYSKVCKHAKVQR